MSEGETILTRFTAAVDEFGGRVGAIRGDQWSGPTPCTEWDVRALVNHLVGELMWMPPLLAGKTIAEVGDRLDGDLLGSDPLAAWTNAVQEAVAAVEQPGALDRIVYLSYGDTPSAAYVTEVAADLTVHAWDLARGIGAPDQLDSALVQWVYPQAKERIGPGGIPGYIEPAVPVADGATDQERLLALYGRRA